MGLAARRRLARLREQEEQEDGALQRLRHLFPSSGEGVAVVTLQGTLCPVTLAHVQVLEEARLLLQGRPSSLAAVARRPQHLPTFHLVLGVLGLNGDDYVAAKFREQPFIPQKERKMLVDLATEAHDWIASSDHCWSSVGKLLGRLPGAAWFELDGADVALRSRTWAKANAERRYACAGRRAEPGRKNGTGEVLAAMEEEGRGTGSQWYQQGHFLLLPELPDLSSSAVRRALAEGDEQGLREMVHPAVADWCLEHGPYRPQERPPVKGKGRGKGRPVATQMRAHGRATAVVSLVGTSTVLGALHAPYARGQNWMRPIRVLQPMGTPSSPLYSTLRLARSSY